MSVCLCMIVKNESAVLARCLRSVRQKIDAYCIVDTGSSDDTIAIVRRELHDIPGDVLERPWQDFGTNRTENLDAAYGLGDWLLIIDADEQLNGWFANLNPHATSFEIEIRDHGTRWWSKRLLRADLEWSYDGAAHAVPESQRPDIAPARLIGPWIEHHDDGGCKDGRRERNISLLRAHVELDRASARSWFYLANEYRAAGDTENAISAYTERLQLGGWTQELWQCHYRIGQLVPYGAIHFQRAYELIPERLEAHYALAHLYRENGMPRNALLWLDHAVARGSRAPDGLFVEEWIYAWGLDAELVLTLHALGENVALATAGLLERADLTDSYRAVLENSLACAGADESRATSPSSSTTRR